MAGRPMLSRARVVRGRAAVSPRNKKGGPARTAAAACREIRCRSGEGSPASSAAHVGHQRPDMTAISAVADGCGGDASHMFGAGAATEESRGQHSGTAAVDQQRSTGTITTKALVQIEITVVFRDHN